LIQPEVPISFKQAPIIKDHSGQIRTVGFELEFTGISLDAAGKAVAKALGGKLAEKNEALQVVEVDGLGEFQVELDWSYLKKAAEQNPGTDHLSLLANAASLVVPVEVVCPPILITALDKLDSLVSELRQAGARGTDDSLLAAYGVHINASLPALDAGTIHRHIKAFTLLQWWLVKTHAVNISRRITPYIDLFPETYVRKLMQVQHPDIDNIFDDYFEHNATRNRALDLLPLLAYIDEARVRRVVDDDRIKARPTFHYRLPNCAIDEADWSLSKSWNIWCLVEELANREDLLTTLGSDFIEASRPLLGVDQKLWIEKIDKCVKDHGLA
jgi:hypothetical protein